VRLVLCNAPPARAPEIAKALVEEGLAACVTLSPVRSIYRWQGALCEEEEVTLTLKVADAKWGACRSRLLELHPYEVPEVLALPVDHAASHGLYLAWVEGG
jgi:periplasmic divalent cation tolerance protein